MAEDGGYKVQHPEEDGRSPFRRQSLLRQVHPKGRSRADTRSHCRSPRECRSDSCMLRIAQLIVMQRPEQNELSLALVPRDHALISIPTLEAEAFGLLDRLLGVFQEAPR